MTYPIAPFTKILLSFDRFIIVEASGADETLSNSTTGTFSAVVFLLIQFSDSECILSIAITE